VENNGRSAFPNNTGSQVSNFHNSSRLHFLGTWRERCEKWQAELRETGTDNPSLIEGRLLSEFRQRLQSPAPSPIHSAETRLWALLDMDCFFAAIVHRDSPHLANVPMAVVSSLSGSGELCSCNYAARAEGVTADLWSVDRGRAVLQSLKLVPLTETILRAVEYAFHQVFQLMVVACNGDIDRVHVRSCDEAFIEIQDVDDPVAWADAVRWAVISTTKCACSIGTGPSQVVAKLACKACKPDGSKHVVSTAVSEFMAETRLSTLPQVGRALESKLDECGLVFCKDVLTCPRALLHQKLGEKQVQALLLWCRGEDSADVAQPAKRKSMSAEINFGVRLRDRSDALRLISEVTSQLCERLTVGKYIATHLTLKLKIAVIGWVEPVKKGGHGHCDDMSRCIVLPSATGDSAQLLAVATRLFDGAKPDPTRIKGLGLAARVDPSVGAAAVQTKHQGTLNKFFQRGAPSSTDIEARCEQKPFHVTGPRARSRSPHTNKSTPLEASLHPRSNRSPHAAVPLGAEVLIDVDEMAVDEQPRSAEKLVECPVCARQIAASKIESHVNDHFDPRRSDSRMPSAYPTAAMQDSSHNRSVMQQLGAGSCESVCEIIDD